MEPIRCLLLILSTWVKKDWDIWFWKETCKNYVDSVAKDAILGVVVMAQVQKKSFLF